MGCAPMIYSMKNTEILLAWEKVECYEEVVDQSRIFTLNQNIFFYFSYIYDIMY